VNQLLIIADGDAELCDSYEEMLMERGYDVITTSDGLDCLKRLRQATPAALVLDLDLRWGGCDGVLAWLRQDHPAHEVAVILTAAAGNCPPAIAHFIEPPVVAFLPKPFAVKSLEETVHFAVAKWQQRGSAKLNRVTEEPEPSIR
jgi:DNA-binding NtrC family response regulator